MSVNQQYPELAAIAPLRSRGARVYPDLYNHLPSRLVPCEEAVAKNWPYFFIGDPCAHGHRAPRWVSSPRMCVDCVRRKKGQRLLSGAHNPDCVTPADNSEPATAQPRQLRLTAKSRAKLLWLLCEHGLNGFGAWEYAAHRMGCDPQELYDVASRDARDPEGFYQQCVAAEAMGAECTAEGNALMQFENGCDPSDPDDHPDTLTAEQRTIARKLIELYEAGAAARS